MDRLTFEGNFCDISKCAATRYGEHCKDGSCTQRKVWEKLKGYEIAEEQGRLLRLSCKPGEYWTHDKKRYYITAIIVTKNGGVMVEYVADGDGELFLSETQYFSEHFTREESESPKGE